MHLRVFAVLLALQSFIFDGSHFVLTLHDGHAFERALLGEDGAPVSATLPATAGDASALASSGHGYLSVTSSGGAVTATRLDGRGTTLDARPIASAAGVRDLQLRWDGKRYVLAWSDGARLGVAFIGDDGSVTDGGILTDDAERFAVTGREGVSLVAWSSSGMVYAHSFPGQTYAIAGGTLWSEAAGGLDGFMVLSEADGIVSGRHFDVDGHPDTTFALPAGIGPSAMVRERYTYAMAWSEGNVVRALRLDPMTGELHGPFVVATLGGSVERVVLAAHTDNTLIAYAAPGGVYAKRIDEAGVGTLLVVLPAHRRAAGR